MSKIIVLFAVILIEGYVVLASELVAIRQILPFVGSGTETIAIVIASVLMPLAFGYYIGGKYKPYKHRGKLITIRRKLIRNVINAGLILCLGLSYIFLEVFFGVLNAFELTNRILQTAIYSLLFMVYPVFLLGQTVPLISNYFSKQKLAKITGRMLFFSTAGSFLGSIVSTLVLMATIGVHNTVIVTVGLMVLLILVLNKRIVSWNTGYAILIASVTIALNNNSMMASLNIVENNNYSTIQIIEKPEQNARIMRMNRSESSKYAESFELMFDYIKFVEPTFITPTLDNQEPKKILVIGAGGFTLGLEDTHNEYTFIDIDKSLKEVSEKYLLKDQLTPNKKFIPEPARAFLKRNKTKYDLIIIDAYSNVYDIPPQLITKEFFQQTKETLNKDGIIIFNAIVDPIFSTDYSVKIDNTLRTVFPHITRRDVQKYNAWEQNGPINVIYTYHSKPNYVDGIYTDNLNTYYLDR